MALKVPKENPQLSEPLTGRDAAELIAYIDAPAPPEGHNAYLSDADRSFAEQYDSVPANALYT